MKKRLFLMVLTTTVLTSALAGCGRKEENNANDNTVNEAATEEIIQEDTETETIMGTEEDTTNQLQLGNAVEIPEGWDGEAAETDAHGQLERVIAEYCGVAETDYANVRYYYNYVDLNGDSKNEILAFVIGNEVAGIDGTMLLWIDDSENGNITKDSVKQSFKKVGTPVYISNHMTEGYRDLILADDSAMAAAKVETTSNADANAVGEPASGTDVNAADEATNGTDTKTRSVDSDTTQGNATKQAPADGTVENTESATTTSLEKSPADENLTDAILAEPEYRLLVWTGEKYQELEEGTVLENLEGQEGTAIITNNLEADFSNDNYHFLGEAM